MRHPARPRAVALLAVVGSVALGVADARAAGIDDAAFVSQSVPSTLFCGQTASVSVTMRNTGTSVWLRNTYALRSQNPPGTTRWGVASVPPASNVGTATNATFSFTITAPATGGTYAFQWQMHNGVAYFGALTPTVQIPVFCEGANGYKAGYRELTGTTLDKLFNDNAHVVDDTAFSSPAHAHVETSTVFFGGKYWLYHRNFEQRGVSVATSTDGTTFTAYNGGASVLSGPGDVSAPNVMVDRDAAGRPRLAMVFEHCDGCATATPTGTRIGRSYSYDGVTWSAPVDVVAPGPSSWDGHIVGTPNVVRTPDGRYRVGYHAHPTSGDPANNFLTIAFADGASLDATLAKSSLPSVGNNTAAAPGWWARAGVGKRDIVKEGAYWYMAFEGFRGDVNCSTNAILSWGLARTTDPTFRTGWQFSQRNPIRIDRQGRQCGEDMVSFQVVNGAPYVVIPGMDQLAGGVATNVPVKRYRIVDGPRGRITSEIVAASRTSDGQGYYEVNAAGNVYAYGSATFHGSPAPAPSPVVGIAAKPGGGGYWITTARGHVYGYGTAGYFGGADSLVLNKPIVGIAATPSGNGYWLVGADGGIFNYGDAPLKGSMGGQFLAAPVVGMAATASGQGYWLVASDGGIFNYGDAPYSGSMGGQALNQPIVGIAAAPDNGYWMVGRDGGIFAFPSSTPYVGSTGGWLADMPNATPTSPNPAWAIGITSAPASMGAGYWIVFRDGGVLALGSARYHGDPSFA
ncbi:MAG TPA: hypothetical protein VF519_06655 [Mycobacteriales bacterium]|jgi:hypothetical protein